MRGEMDVDARFQAGIGAPNILTLVLLLETPIFCVMLPGAPPIFLQTCLKWQGAVS